MDYVLVVALNYHFDVILCDVKSDSQTFTDPCKNMEETKTTGDHHIWNDI